VSFVASGISSRCLMRGKCTALRREYKEHAGLDHKKGIIPQYHKELLQSHVQSNYSRVVERNLIKGGKGSRFTKGGEGIGKYKRSSQTMAVLKERFKNLNRQKSN
jgi:hypothetical protein